MPELPEVDKMVDQMRPFCSWAILDATVIRGDKYLPETQVSDLGGTRVTQIYRRGKYMVWQLDKGHMICHNAMSGYWDSAEDPWTFDYVEGKRQATDKDVRVELLVAPPLEFSDRSTRTLRFHDVRLFGSLTFYPSLHARDCLPILGPEAIETPNMLPGSPVMTFSDFFQVMNRSKLPVKSVLMDQTKIAGIGNIYAAESCWVSGVDPRRLGQSLNSDEILSLFNAFRIILKSAIYRDLDYGSLVVYRKETCSRCNSKILREDIKGRSSYFCPTCQK